MSNTVSDLISAFYTDAVEDPQYVLDSGAFLCFTVNVEHGRAFVHHDQSVPVFNCMPQVMGDHNSHQVHSFHGLPGKLHDELRIDRIKRCGMLLGKGIRQGCILSPCLFNVYAEYIMRNARLDEAQAEIKIARRNINFSINLRYVDDTTLMAESEELKSLLMNMKEKSEKVDLKLNIQKTKITVSSPTT